MGCAGVLAGPSSCARSSTQRGARAHTHTHHTHKLLQARAHTHTHTHTHTRAHTHTHTPSLPPSSRLAPPIKRTKGGAAAEAGTNEQLQGGGRSKVALRKHSDLLGRIFPAALQLPRNILRPLRATSLALVSMCACVCVCVRAEAIGCAAAAPLAQRTLRSRTGAGMAGSSPAVPIIAECFVNFPKTLLPSVSNT